MSDPINKSCANCPSFLKPQETVSKFKKSIGSPMCGRYGHVLGKPGLPESQAEKLQRHFANNCDSYGSPLPPLPLEKRMAVVLPDMDRRMLSIEPAKQAACTSCIQCTAFVREDKVADELGWASGLCAAKGKLVLTTQLKQEATDCQYREFGTQRLNTAGLHLLPEYESAFNLAADPVRAYFKNKGHITEPQEYPSDKEVTVEEHDAGIRAWREVQDPDGSGKVAYLPIYEYGFFSPEEQAKIPKTGDAEHPELYVDHFGGVYLCAVAWTELDETPTMWGQAGNGKTELFRHLAWLMCLPFERMSITASSEVDDLIGKMKYTPEEGTFFEYGRLALAWGKPCVLVIDEPNLGPLEVWHILRPLTDNSKQMVIDQNRGESKPRHDDCYMGFALNPAWDTKNIGALPIADADVNRLFHVFIDLPPASLEREIIANRVREDGWEIGDEQIDLLMNVAGELRDLAKDNTLPITWGIRPQLKVARALRWFAPVTAYRRAVGDYLEPEAQAILLDTVKSHVEGV